MFLEAVQLQNIFILFEGSVFWNFFLLRVVSQFRIFKVILICC